MRSLIFIGLATLFVTQPTFAQWITLENGPTTIGRHDDIVFTSETTGWLVNGRGDIYHTTDYGESWDPIAKISAYLRSVAFVDDLHGWIGTLAGDKILYETIDGGHTWNDISSRISGPKPYGVCGMWVVNDTLAFGVGTFNGPAVVLRTKDAGATWDGTDVSNIGVETLIDVYFRDENTGFIIGGTSKDLDGDAVVARTDDGGDSWSIIHQTQKIPSVGGEWGWKISFPHPDTGYVSLEYPFSNMSGWSARYLKTIDGGDTWTEHTIPGSNDPAGLQAIGFITPSIGWAGGRGTTSITTDGGETWQQTTHLDNKVNRIRAVSDSVAYAVGWSVHRYLSGNTPVSNETVKPAPKIFTLKDNYPNPFRPSTTIAYELHQPARVRVRVLDVLGRNLKILADEMQGVGPHAVMWDGTDESGIRVAAGSYMYVIDIGPITEMKTMVILK